jgi:hypothetical protein
MMTSVRHGLSPDGTADGCLSGDVCMIPNCREFFIATADHIEWGTAHTVWGQVGRGLDPVCNNLLAGALLLSTCFCRQ